MKREFLKSLGIEDASVIDKILDENGSDLNRERSKFGDYETIKDRAEKAEKALKDFKGVDIGKLTKERDELKIKLDNAVADKDKEINGLKLDYEIKSALAKAGAKNAKAVKALLDSEKLEFKDGKLTGLDEQITAIKTDNGYMFNDSGSNTPHFSGKTGGNGTTVTKEDYARMGYRERLALKRENPDTYAALRKD